jgi:cytochrome c oxidase assembly factor CtaG
LATPVASLTVFLAVVAAWHVPSLYDAAQGHTLIHNLEHLTFFVAGLLYWWPIVQGVRGRGPLAPMGGALLYVLAPASEGGLIGGAFTFSDRVVYPYYAHPAAAAGISPLADQHLAGIVMWLGGGLISVLTAAVLIGCFLAAEDRIGRDRLPSAPSTAPGPHSPRRPDETPG